MTELTIVNWNVEWMNNWFTADNAGAPKLKDSVAGVSSVDALAKRVADVIKGMDADLITVQEGPSRASEMGIFVDAYLGGEYELHGPVGTRQQRLFGLENKNSESIQSVELLERDHDIVFNDPWDVDIDGDMVPDGYYFTRPPLVLKVVATTGMEIRVVSLHTKSKYVHHGQSMWNDSAKRDEFIQMALKARRRISAEAMRVREYIDALFEEDADAAIIVTGDFNDGPGLDFFERTYLTHNLVDLIAGSPFIPQRMLRHTFVDLEKLKDNYTVEFFDFVDDKHRKALLDHILVSHSLFWKGNSRNAKGKIQHKLYEASSDESLAGDREKYPSDHRPQTATMKV